MSRRSRRVLHACYSLRSSGRHANARARSVCATVGRRVAVATADVVRTMMMQAAQAQVLAGVQAATEVGASTIGSVDT
jgi:hypothetical protein